MQQLLLKFVLDKLPVLFYLSNATIVNTSIKTINSSANSINYGQILISSGVAFVYGDLSIGGLFAYLRFPCIVWTLLIIRLINVFIIVEKIRKFSLHAILTFSNFANLY